jgi:hypothetical protein
MLKASALAIGLALALALLLEGRSIAAESVGLLASSDAEFGTGGVIGLLIACTVIGCGLLIAAGARRLWEGGRRTMLLLGNLAAVAIVPLILAPATPYDVGSLLDKPMHLAESILALLGTAIVGSPPLRSGTGLDGRP